MPHISEAQFRDRFVSLILGARDLPKKDADLHILLISSILKLDPNRTYLEGELNGELRKWTGLFGANFGLDHVTLRRFLVDEKYVARDTAGKSYKRQTSELRCTFDPSIGSLDLEQMIREARDERETRKQLHKKSSRP